MRPDDCECREFAPCAPCLDQRFPPKQVGVISSGFIEVPVELDEAVITVIPIVSQTREL